MCEILNDIFQTHAVIGRLGGDEFGIAFTCKNEDFIIQIDSLIQERTQYPTLHSFKQRLVYPME